MANKGDNKVNNSNKISHLVDRDESNEGYGKFGYGINISDAIFIIALSILLICPTLYIHVFEFIVKLFS